MKIVYNPRFKLIHYLQLAPFDYTWRSGLVSRLGLDVSPDYWRAIASRFGLDASPYKLPEIWEAQTAALSIRNTGMAVTNDALVDPANIHQIGLAVVVSKWQYLHAWPRRTADRARAVRHGPLATV